MRQNQATKYVVAKSGTRWQKIKDPPRPKREKIEAPSKALAPLINGEAEGDVMLAVLMATRNLIADPEEHTRKARAVSAGGQVVEPTSPEAKRWSMFGAIECVTSPAFTQKQRREVITHIKKSMPSEARGMALFQWEAEPNTKHSQIIHLLNMSIALRKHELRRE